MHNVTVTTGAEVAVLSGGFGVSQSPPVLLTLNPSSGQQGQQIVSVTITGQFTHFAQGMTTASFGDGISVGGSPLGGFGPVTVSSPTTATAQISVNICALTGLRSVILRTGSESVALNAGFTVTTATSWLQLNPIGTIPSARSQYTSVYDDASNRMIIFGGGGTSTNGISNEVWVLANANGLNGAPIWTQLNPTGTPPAPRRDHVAVYDSAHNRMIVFGGDISTTGASIPVANDIWVLTNANGLGGTPAWIQILPQGPAPVARRFSAAGYDPVTNRLTIFGGWTNSLVSVNDVWVLSNANGLGGASAWTQLAPTGPLSSVRNASFFAFDPINNRLTVFGGEIDQNGGSPASLFNDVWVLTGANGLGGTPTWIQLLANGAAGSPSPRTTIASSPPPYNLGTNQLIVVGGGTFGNVSNEVWLLLNANGLGGQPTWVQLADQTIPAAASSGGVATYDPSTDRAIQFAALPFNGTFVLTNPTNFAVPGPSPRLLSVIPNSAPAGRTLNATVTGVCTDFVPGSSIASFGAGISVGGSLTGASGSVTVTSPTAATIQLVIDPAATGTRDVTVTTGAEVVTLTNAFTVTAGTPVLTQVNPNTGQQGQANLAVTITGIFTHFSSSSTVTFSGTGITAGAPTSATAATLTVPVTIAGNAPLGAQGIQVVTGTETVSLANAFTVNASVNQPPVVTAGPNQTISPPVPVSMVSYWPLDNGVADDLVGGNSGTATNTAAIVGRVNGALHFDGVDSIVTTPYAPSLDTSKMSQLTAETWVRFSQNPPVSQTYLNLVGKQQLTSPGSWSFELVVRQFNSFNGGQPFFTWRVCGTASQQQCSIDFEQTAPYATVPTDLSWHHVAGTYDSGTGTANLYVDGALARTGYCPPD